MSARAAETPLVLEMILNGRATGVLGNFLDRDGVLMATPAELSDLGFLVPSNLAGSQDPIPVSTLSGVEAVVNQQSQTIVIKASDEALRPQVVNGPRDFRQNTTITPPMTGFVMDYDLLATQSNGQMSGGGEVDARFFNSYGTISTTAEGLFAPTQGQSAIVRLDSSWTYAEPESLRRWTGGDIITGSLGATRPIRIGGFQMESDFTLRPDLITFPVPQLSGSTQVPTTVDILVNGVRQLSQPVTPGPFQIRSLPIVTGAGEVAIAYQDALGRQTITTVPFYASNALLKEGLTSYSVEGGLIRQGYSQVSNEYGQGAIVGTIRHGFTDWLTLDAHAEATGRLGMATAGADIRVVNWGVVSISGSGSINDGTAGWTSSVSAERNSTKYNLSASATYGTSGYRDIAAITGSPSPHISFRISGGLQFGSLGSLGLAYIRQLPFSADQATLSSGSAAISLLTMSYQVQLADRLNFYATGYINRRAQDAASGLPATGYGAMIGVSYFFGGKYGVGASASSDAGRVSYVSQFNKSATDVGEYGLHITDSEGFARRRLGEFDYEDGAGLLTLGVDQSPGSIAYRAGLQGSLVVSGDGLFAARTIPDSFAIVRTGDVGDVGVLYENRLIGQTDSNGTLLVPDLRAYQVNRITLKATDLPPDVTAGKTDVYVRPPDRSGVLVDFDVHGSNGALLRLTDSQDHMLPVGSIVQFNNADLAVVGFDGEVYLTDLKPRNEFQIQLPDGTHCDISFPYEHVKGDLPTIPVKCKGGKGA